MFTRKDLSVKMTRYSSNFCLGGWMSVKRIVLLTRKKKKRGGKFLSFSTLINVN